MHATMFPPISESASARSAGELDHDERDPGDPEELGNDDPCKKGGSEGAIAFRAPLHNSHPLQDGQLRFRRTDGPGQPFEGAYGACPSP